MRKKNAEWSNYEKHVLPASIINTHNVQIYITLSKGVMIGDEKRSRKMVSQKRRRKKRLRMGMKE
jgi:hypothetical protein